MRLGRVVQVLFRSSFQCRAFDLLPAAQNRTLAAVVHTVERRVAARFVEPLVIGVFCEASDGTLFLLEIPLSFVESEKLAAKRMLIEFVESVGQFGTGVDSVDHAQDRFSH